MDGWKEDTKVCAIIIVVVNLILWNLPTYVPTYLLSVSQSVSRSDDQREQRIHVGILLHRIQRRLYYRENRRRCGNDKMKSVRYFY